MSTIAGNRGKRKIATALRRGYLDATTPHVADISGALSFDDTYIDVYNDLTTEERFLCHSKHNREESFCALDKLRTEKNIEKMRTAEGRHIFLSSSSSSSFSKVKEHKSKAALSCITTPKYTKSKTGSGKTERKCSTDASTMYLRLRERTMGKQKATMEKPGDAKKQETTEEIKQRRKRAMEVVERQKEKEEEAQQIATEKALIKDAHSLPRDLPSWKHAPCYMGQPHMHKIDHTALKSFQTKLLTAHSGFLSFEAFYSRFVIPRWSYLSGQSIAMLVIMQSERVGLHLHCICVRWGRRLLPGTEDALLGKCCIAFRVNETTRYLVKLMFDCTYSASHQREFLDNHEENAKGYKKKTFNWGGEYLTNPRTLDSKERARQDVLCSQLGREDCDHSEYSPNEPSKADGIRLAGNYAFLRFTESPPEKQYFCCVCSAVS